MNLVGKTYTVPDTGHKFRIMGQLVCTKSGASMWIVKNLTPVYDVPRIGKRWRRRSIPMEYLDE